MYRQDALYTLAKIRTLDPFVTLSKYVFVIAFEGLFLQLLETFFNSFLMYFILVSKLLLDKPPKSKRSIYLENQAKKPNEHYESANSSFEDLSADTLSDFNAWWKMVS